MEDDQCHTSKRLIGDGCNYFEAVNLKLPLLISLRLGEWRGGHICCGEHSSHGRLCSHVPSTAWETLQWNVLAPIRISRKQYLFVVVDYCGLLLCWGLLWLPTAVLGLDDIALILFWVSRSTMSPCQEHPSKETSMPFAAHSMCGFTKFLDWSSNLFSCFGKNGSGGNTAVLSWRSALEANFSCSLMCKGEAV